MKKFFVFVLFLLILSVGNISFGQVAAGVSHTEIANSIEKAKVMNRELSGIENPDSIYPNQIVWVPVVVNKGDTQWAIHRDELSKGEEIFDNTLSDDFEEVKEDSSTKERSAMPISWPWDLLLVFLFLLVVAAVCFMIWSMLKEHTSREKINISKDPTKEGEPFVSAGVKNETDAGKHFVSLATKRNPGRSPSLIVVKNKKRVYVSTPDGKRAVVEFADGSKKKLAFRNTPGWEASVSVDGGMSFKKEIFFEECGNPVYRRSSMKNKGLILTNEPISFGQSEPEENGTLKRPLTEIDGELISVSKDHSIVADEFLRTQEAHKVTMEYTKNADGSFTIKSVFETKNLSDIKKDKKKS